MRPSHSHYKWKEVSPAQNRDAADNLGPQRSLQLRIVICQNKKLNNYFRAFFRGGVARWAVFVFQNHALCGWNLNFLIDISMALSDAKLCMDQ